MPSQEYEFTMGLRVYDDNQLLAAALAHPDTAAADMARDDFLDADGHIDIAACLVMLLDPGSLPGCSIHDSSAGVVGSYHSADQDDT